MPQPPGHPPRPSHAAPAEPPEPRSELGPESLVPTERSPRTPTHFSRVQTRHSGSLAGSSRQQRGRELIQRRSFSSHSSEPVQPPGSNAGRERKKKAAEGRARPKSWRGSAHISPGTPTSRSHWSVMTPAPQSHAPAGSRPCPGREPSV